MSAMMAAGAEKCLALEADDKAGTLGTHMTVGINSTMRLLVTGLSGATTLVRVHT